MLLPHDELGSGRPVVLLHARPADRTMWRGHLPLLAAAGFRAIALDLPGHGAAVPPAHHSAPPAEDVLETLGHLGIDRFDVVGNSLGALVALQIAVAAPDRVRSLVAIGYRRHDQPRTDAFAAALRRERDRLGAGDLDGAVQAGVEAWVSPDAPASVKDHAAAMLRGNLELRRVHGEPPRAADPDPLELRPLAARMLVVVGEQDFPDFVTGGEALLEGAGGLVVAPGAAHLVPLDQPEWTCGLLQGFLRDRPAGHRVRADRTA
ncbi:alpha/beta fold hydrolase [Lentzea sp. NPDC058436]|uniref:alpha/beta fold hydrolase n=1 Tax=Lentzea sp. NPDC058436 TaxID=3346499 RepID=UPI003656F8E8